MFSNRRNLNSWLFLLALAVMANRIITPFAVPALVVHDTGYVEVCSWEGVFERILLDSDGNRVESKQPFSYCPQITPGSLLTTPVVPLLAEQALPFVQQAATSDTDTCIVSYRSLPPSPRAPPISPAFV